MVWCPLSKSDFDHYALRSPLNQWSELCYRVKRVKANDDPHSQSIKGLGSKIKPLPLHGASDTTESIQLPLITSISYVTFMSKNSNIGLHKNVQT